MLATYFFLKGEDFGCLGRIPDKEQRGAVSSAERCFCSSFWLKTLLSFGGTFGEFLDVACGAFLARGRGGRCQWQNGVFCNVFCFGGIICLRTLLSFGGTFWEFL